METTPTLKQRVIQALSDVLPADAILSNNEVLRPYECDGLTAYQRLPLAVVLPTST